MKEMTIRVSDELAELVERWTEHTPEMEVIDTSDCLGDDERDLCFKQAIVPFIGPKEEDATVYATNVARCNSQCNT